MCNTHKCLLNINSLLSSQSNAGVIKRPIKQRDNPRKPEGLTPWRRGRHSRGRCTKCRKGHGAPSGLLCPAPLPVPGLASSLGDRLRVSGRDSAGGAVPGEGRWREAEGGGRASWGLTSAASQSAPRARRGHGERRAALAGPVHPPGHQLCRHRCPVLFVPAEGPGRPRAQGQCWRPSDLSRSSFPG